MISERCLGYDGRHGGSGEVGGRGGKSVPSWELEGKEGGGTDPGLAMDVAGVLECIRIFM